jgi:hypothetical protein
VLRSWRGGGFGIDVVRLESDVTDHGVLRAVIGYRIYHRRRVVVADNDVGVRSIREISGVYLRGDDMLRTIVGLNAEVLDRGRSGNGLSGPGLSEELAAVLDPPEPPYPAGIRVAASFHRTGRGSRES